MTIAEIVLSVIEGLAQLIQKLIQDTPDSAELQKLCIARLDQLKADLQGEDLQKQLDLAVPPKPPVA